MITPIAIVSFTLLGLIIGSLLNVCIDRIPAGKSIIRPPSHCDSCNQRLREIDLIPIFSYIWLKGRCRYCGNKIPLRIPIVEFITASLFALITWSFLHQHSNLSVHLAMPLIYACLFVLIAFIDLKEQVIINMTIYVGVALALIFSFFWFNFFWPDFSIWPSQGHGIGILSSLLGGTVGAIFILIPNLITRGRGMGGGDVMLAGLIGAATGFPLIIVALIIGIASGGLLAITLLLLRKKKRKDAIPFGPFLCLGAMATLLWGPQIMHWYSSLFSGA
jgi:leader peptidase (prepilin peptidase)/N-methyltransferase